MMSFFDHEKVNSEDQLNLHVERARRELEQGIQIEKRNMMVCAQASRAKRK